jgi:hypothetical protein
VDSLRVEIEKIVGFAFIRDIDMAIDIYRYRHRSDEKNKIN